MILILFIFILQELTALPVFYLIRRYYQGKSTNKDSVAVHTWLYSVFKGILERLVVFIGLMNDLPYVLGFFGALKLGTRLDTDKNDRVSNDYFLIGNLMSILLVVISYLIWKHLT